MSALVRIHWRLECHVDCLSQYTLDQFQVKILMQVVL